jgi:hypothetical protein
MSSEGFNPKAHRHNAASPPRTTKVLIVEVLYTYRLIIPLAPIILMQIHAIQEILDGNSRAFESAPN